MTFTSPHLEYALLWPLFVVFGGACVGVLLEAFLPRGARFVPQVLLTKATLVAALVGVIVVGVRHADSPRYLGQGSVAFDGPGIFLQGLVLAVSLLGLALFAERRVEVGATAFTPAGSAPPGSAAEREAHAHNHETTEVFPLFLFAVGGMALFVVVGDLLLLFVALEVLSLPLYLLSALARRRRLLSQEAALKYFLLGAFSSAFLLYGVALVFGAFGTVDIGALAGLSGDDPLAWTGLALILVGLLFKVGAVPFHSWVPDVYQGAPTPVTAWMSAATKVAAFGALARVAYAAFGRFADVWQPAVATIAVATLVVGAVVAIVQTDVKRMLAYSAVAHSGFLLVGLLGYGSDGEGRGVGALLVYLVGYSLATVGAFALTSLVRTASKEGGNGEASSFEAWRGLGRRHPWVAFAFTVFLFSMAGLPLTAGFIGKWAVLASAASVGYWPVVVVAVVCSIVAVFFYVRFVLLLWFEEPGESAAGVVPSSFLTWGPIGLAVLATIALGVWPAPILSLIDSAGTMLS